MKLQEAWEPTVPSCVDVYLCINIFLTLRLEDDDTGFFNHPDDFATEPPVPRL